MVQTTIDYTVSDPTKDYFVQIAGDFSDWQPVAMDEDEENPGVYKVTVDLEPGKSYAYKFLVNGGWFVAPDDRPSVTDAAGNVNNVITVEETVADSLEKKEPEETEVPAAAPEIPKVVPSHDELDPSDLVDEEGEDPVEVEDPPADPPVIPDLRAPVKKTSQETVKSTTSSDGPLAVFFWLYNYLIDKLFGPVRRFFRHA